MGGKITRAPTTHIQPVPDDSVPLGSMNTAVTWLEVEMNSTVGEVKTGTVGVNFFLKIKCKKVRRRDNCPRARALLQMIRYSKICATNRV